MDVTVVHEQGNSRFTAKVHDHLAKLEYSLAENVLTLEHTGVPKELGGQGLAGQLVQAAVDWAETENFTVAPWCGYTRKWLERNPKEAARIKIDWSEPPADYNEPT